MTARVREGERERERRRETFASICKSLSKKQTKLAKTTNFVFLGTLFGKHEKKNGTEPRERERRRQLFVCCWLRRLFVPGDARCL